MEIGKLTICGAMEGLRSRAFSSVELARAVIAAIDGGDGAVGAYLWLDYDDALRQAAAADTARAMGSDAPLLGVPLAVKDNICVAGQPCTCASRMLAGFKAPYDATAVSRLRGSGAVFLGRTNMDEFALGTSTESSAFRVTDNPAAPGHTPGGSSGGSAAAVAGGMALAALGSDTGGSIRQPASHCGCVGLKPSFGRVSRHGLVAGASSFDQVGPLARSVADAALLLSVMAGHDPHDATTIMEPAPLAPAAGDLRGVRVGLPGEYLAGWVDGDVRAATIEAAAACAQLGAEVLELSLPHTDYAVATYCVLAAAELSSNLARFDGMRYGHRSARPAASAAELTALSRGEGFGAEVKRRLIFGTHVLSGDNFHEYYHRAQCVRTLIARDFAAAFDQCHVLLTPVAPRPARRLGGAGDNPVDAYRDDTFVVAASLAGHCAMSLPWGTSAAGLPIGVQVMAAAAREEVLVRVGAALERAREETP